MRKIILFSTLISTILSTVYFLAPTRATHMAMMTHSHSHEHDQPESMPGRTTSPM